MIDLIRISVVFAAILVLLRLKWNVGYVLAAASLLLWLLYMMSPGAVLSTVTATVTDVTTVKLFFALTLIRVLEMVLREQQVLARMTEASRRLLKRKKAVIVSMPMLIGLLPSLGGAYFSAPMVEESTKGLKMTSEEKGFVNYWFRHPWEYVLPLYPGILLASAISGIELRSFILANLTYALLIFLTGFLFSMRNVRGAFTPGRHDTGRQDGEASEVQGKGRAEGGAFSNPLWSFLPVSLVLLLVIALRIELHIALALTIVALFLFYRVGLRDIGRTLRYGFTLDVVVLIFGVMLFKTTMESSGAVSALSRYLADLGIPALPVIVLLPFLSGILTGITVGFVGSTFPLLISLAGGAHLNEMTLAFASGFLGVLLSPVHLCLVLTREYFKADIWGIYRKIIPAGSIVMASAFVVYYFV